MIAKADIVSKGEPIIQPQHILVLENQEGVLFEDTLRDALFHKHKIYAKSIGLSPSSKNNKAFSDAPYLIDKYAVNYLALSQSPFLTAPYPVATPSLAYRIYASFIDHYTLVDGHKFGCLFMLYKGHPEQCHAESLVFTNSCLNHITRLAQISNKKCILAEEVEGKLLFFEIERVKEDEVQKEELSQ